VTKPSDRGPQHDAYRAETTASASQLDFRRQLEDLFVSSPLSTEDLLFNLGMYTRSSLLVKFIVMNDLYERIQTIPGAIMEFGTWWGQNLVLFENLRAIHEPFNKQRIIVGFDTFAGYTPAADKDRASAFRADSYTTPTAYREYLANLLQVHEGNNVLGHLRNRHQLIEGDVEQTAPTYFTDYPGTIVALAYFDLGLYRPTRAALAAIKPHMVPGSVMLLDELTWAESPGEAIAFKEVFGGTSYTIEKCRHYPSKNIVTLR
jgi:macrocin-O-methyltransferase TylF-like protien